LLTELRAGAPHLSVGIHAADLLRIGEELSELERAGVRMIHLDVMDGVFCPQMTFGPLVVQAVGDGFVKDVHLMIEDPLPKLGAFVDAGASMITFHVESTCHPHRALRSLANSGVLRGVALNPGTPLGVLEPLVDELEIVLLLAIDPGWGGQSFAPATGERLASVRRILGERAVLVGVDGAITKANVGYVASLRPDVIVSGSAVFAGGDTYADARFMVDAAREGWLGGRESAGG
jgi:ribulose-phosphate 3-epimerase